MHSADGRREATFSYLKQIATALDDLGYGGALLPTGIGCPDAWVTAAALVPYTKRLRYLVAVRPGVMHPSIGARMATSFDQISEGRLLINVVTGSGEEHLAVEGVFVPQAERYDVTDEFLTVWRALLRGETVNFEGKHLQIKNGRVWPLPLQSPCPPLFFGGSSEKALAVAGSHADVYLTWGEPLQLVREKLDKVRKHAAENGRTVRFGIRKHVVVHETELEAWTAAESLLRNVTDETIQAIQQRLTANSSKGQRRMQSLHGGDGTLSMLRQIYGQESAWLDQVRERAIVGTPEIVAERLREYAALGIDTFILSGYPHLEKAYRFAETVFPLLPRTSPDDSLLPAIEGNKRTDHIGWWSAKPPSPLTLEQKK